MSVTTKQILHFIPALFLLVLISVHCHFGFYEKGFKEEKEGGKKEKLGFDKPDGFYEYFGLISKHIGEAKSSYHANYAFHELKKALKSGTYRKASHQTHLWTERGPGNVGGRTRSIIIDPDDPTHNTWFAAAVSGGVWKTTNAGQSWQKMTDDLQYLATNTISMAPSNSNIIYVGTGEGYGGIGMVIGNGIYKTTTKGLSWILLPSTDQNKNFEFVNKIVVDKDDPDLVFAATNTGIFRSADGGLSWDSVYYNHHFVQEIIVNPLNSNTMYAAVNRLGIIKSYNKGATWFDAYQGIGTDSRYSITISPVDTNYLFVGAEGAGGATRVYISTDGAGSWRMLADEDGSFVNFLGSQGWFNNVVQAHPFDKKKVFMGGVYLGMFNFSNLTQEGDKEVMRVDTPGIGPFMEFINFGGSYFYGAMSTGTDEEADVEEEDYFSVEIRFGPGMSQKAYRFTVPQGEGAGVPREDYTYQDYVDVPFEAWDTDNNRQLMVSFRDQERDGSFNLIERIFDEEIKGREYLFVHSIDYSETPDPDIAVNGGHYYKMIYFFWPTLPEFRIWNAGTLPSSKIIVQYGKFMYQEASTTVLADEDRNKDLHVDHHDIAIVITDTANEEFMMVEANDGGLGLSTNNGMTWKQLKEGYVTTQFYGIAKMPNSHRYIGGMQDNGTWISQKGQTATAGSAYEIQLKGDGFEALWHPMYPDRIIGSSYYNKISVTIDGGKTWLSATEGIEGDGPFITRLSNSPANPNLVFAVGNKGVYRHTNFCVGRFGWDLIDLGDDWAISDQVTSSHNVEVSLASPSVVWAGAGMNRDPNLKIFLSRDYGETFDTVALYEDRKMGYLSGIATHPSNPATAYLLFSINDCPKILRTTNYGESWEDISGFGMDSTSSNGFPDVMVYSLLVMPYDTNIIWAGTEIGIFESIDGGQNWNFADNGLPAVSVWQMFVQDNCIVVATHGRGIWTTSMYPDAIDPSEIQKEDILSVFPNPAQGITNISFTNAETGDFEISVYDLSGKQVFSGTGVKLQENYHGLINLESLSQGSYVITIRQNRKFYSEKIVVK